MNCKVWELLVFQLGAPACSWSLLAFSCCCLPIPWASVPLHFSSLCLERPSPACQPSKLLFVPENPTGRPLPLGSPRLSELSNPLCVTTKPHIQTTCGILLFTLKLCICHPYRTLGTLQVFTLVTFQSLAHGLGHAQ